jgi:cytokinin dehydrogenase
MIGRRQLLAGLGGTTVLGFNPSTRSWVRAANASSPFDHVPRLDGQLLTDTISLAGFGTDVGNIVHRTPVAGLRPGSVEDIRKVVRFCRRHCIKVAARGQGHTTFGQSQVESGLVVEMGTLNQIHSIGPTSADLDAGVQWKDVLLQGVPQGFTPPVLTGFTALSVGGTLSVGGISSTNAQGAQVDRVQELEVVTGEGEIRRCSARHNRDLFEVALAGLGQCGIITRAVVDVVRAKPNARIFLLNYTDNAQFFRDMRTLLNRGEFDDVFNLWFPDGNGGWLYQMNAVKFFDPTARPDNARLLRGLSIDPSNVQISDSAYLDYVLRVDVVIDFYKQIGLWDGVLHPWFDVFLPNRWIEQYVSHVLPTLTPEDVGSTGFLLLLPQKRSKLTRPFFRVPESSDWVFLFDILTASGGPGADPAFAERMLRRNRMLFDKARLFGGTRYPIGTLDFRRADWIAQYGGEWSGLVSAKRRYDPDGILTPGPGIF